MKDGLLSFQSKKGLPPSLLVEIIESAKFLKQFSSVRLTEILYEV